MAKQIILCADDYGQNPAVSQGIIHLLEQKRLTATSCLASSPYWPSHAPWLIPHLNQIDIGLHFNLTEGMALSELPQITKAGRFPSLPKLLSRAYLRQIDPTEIAAEFKQQLMQFTAAFNKLPDFIDGHQHVLHLPIIRDVILENYASYLKPEKIYLRCVSENNPWQFLQGRARLKRLIIQLTGSSAFKNVLEKQGIPHNLSFAGIYNFAKAYQYAYIFPDFLKSIGHGGLIMCHPGLVSTDTQDPIYRGRHFEYEYFASKKFISDCERLQIELVRFKDMKIS